MNSNLRMEKRLGTVVGLGIRGEECRAKEGVYFGLLSFWLQAVLLSWLGKGQIGLWLIDQEWKKNHVGRRQAVLHPNEPGPQCGRPGREIPLFLWKLKSMSKLWNWTEWKLLCSRAPVLREVMPSSSFYSVLVANGPPGWGGDRNHGVSGTGIRQTSRERERELRGLSVKKRTGIHKLCLSLPVAIYSEKTQNAASPTNLKLYSESIPRFTLSLKEALPLCIGRSYLIECLCLMTGTE